MSPRLLLLAVAPFALAACGDSGEEDLDTSYEEHLPAPVAETDGGMESVPDNDTIEGGPDEQVDTQYSGDAQLPDGETAEQP